MSRAVLFDFNGVLVDDEPLHLELFQEVLTEEGVELSEEDYYRDYLGFDDRDCLSAVLVAAGREPSLETLARLITRKASRYQERIRRDGFPFFPGATELVRALGEAGYLLAIVSGALREEVLGALRQESLDRWVKGVVAAEDVEAGKPDPEGYRKGLEILSTVPPLPDRLIHPHEVTAVEDSPAGLEAARDAGLRTLGVAQTYPPSKLAAADRVVARVADLALVDFAAA